MLTVPVRQVQTICFAKAIFRMGIPVSPKNIFPSNIQGLPTWYEVRISEKGYLGRRDGVDVMVSVNPQSMAQDVADVKSGGYFVYDSTRKLHTQYIRDDIHYIGVPMMAMCIKHYSNPRQRQLFKNVIYVGAIAALLDVEVDVIKEIISQQFHKKQKLIPPNFQALELGINYVKEHYDYPLPLRLERRDLVGDSIMIDGNTACGIGAIYGGATVAALVSDYPFHLRCQCVFKVCRAASDRSGKREKEICYYSGGGRTGSHRNGYWSHLEWRSLLYQYQWDRAYP